MKLLRLLVVVLAMAGAIAFIFSSCQHKLDKQPSFVAPTVTAVVTTTPSTLPSTSISVPVPSPTPNPTPKTNILPANPPHGLEWVMGVWEGTFSWIYDSESHRSVLEWMVQRGLIDPRKAEEAIQTYQQEPREVSLRIFVGWDDSGPLIVVSGPAPFYEESEGWGYTTRMDHATCKWGYILFASDTPPSFVPADIPSSYFLRIISVDFGEVFGVNFAPRAPSENLAFSGRLELHPSGKGKYFLPIPGKEPVIHAAFGEFVGEAELQKISDQPDLCK